MMRGRSLQYFKKFQSGEMMELGELSEAFAVEVLIESQSTLELHPFLFHYYLPFFHCLQIPNVHNINDNDNCSNRVWPHYYVK